MKQNDIKQLLISEDEGRQLIQFLLSDAGISENLNDESVFHEFAEQPEKFEAAAQGKTGADEMNAFLGTDVLPIMALALPVVVNILSRLAEKIAENLTDQAADHIVVEMLHLFKARYPVLIIKHSGDTRTVQLSNSNAQMGTDKSIASIVVAGSNVSGIHCELRSAKDCNQWMLVDLNSEYGTWVGDEKISKAYKLEDSTVFWLGVPEQHDSVNVVFQCNKTNSSVELDKRQQRKLKKDIRKISRQYGLNAEMTASLETSVIGLFS